MKWTEAMALNYTQISDIADSINIKEEEAQHLERLCEYFPMSIPRYYLSLVNADDPDDPIRKMCVPTYFEADMSGQFDTSGESDNTVEPGIQHKYDESALVLTTNRCAMYCRHCFRKRLVGLNDEEILSQFDEVLEYIRNHEEITNVILSGGDALMLSTRRLEAYIDELSQIEHIDLVRIATRMPVVYPMRIIEDRALLTMLARYSRRKQLYIVTQFNHPRELTQQACTAVKLLQQAGIVVKNQTVLLRGVNDDPAVLGKLLRKLTSNGIVPYYIFQCRPVSGVKNHFQVPFTQGYDIVEKAKAMQNGQGKCFKYCMSHPSGKLEIIGRMDDGKMIFKYHQAKNPLDDARVFLREVQADEGWLSEL